MWVLVALAYAGDFIPEGEKKRVEGPAVVLSEATYRQLETESAQLAAVLPKLDACLLPTDTPGDIASKMRALEDRHADAEARVLIVAEHFDACEFDRETAAERAAARLADSEATIESLSRQNGRLKRTTHVLIGVAGALAVTAGVAVATPALAGSRR